MSRLADPLLFHSLGKSVLGILEWRRALPWVTREQSRHVRMQLLRQHIA